MPRAHTQAHILTGMSFLSTLGGPLPSGPGSGLAPPRVQTQGVMEAEKPGPAEPSAAPGLVRHSGRGQGGRWGPGSRAREREGGQGLNLQQLDLLLGLSQLQLGPRERAVQAAPLRIQPHCVLVATKLLALHLHRESRRASGGPGKEGGRSHEKREGPRERDQIRDSKTRGRGRGGTQPKSTPARTQRKAGEGPGGSAHLVQHPLEGQAVLLQAQR